jgi:hypothetical protein
MLQHIDIYLLLEGGASEFETMVDTVVHGALECHLVFYPRFDRLHAKRSYWRYVQEAS